MEQTLSPKADFLVSRIIGSSPLFGKVQGYPNYGKIYYKTNEDLLFPYEEIDFYEKDVLSVLSSGDHVFTARFLEAEKVDAFDINVLTLYYFYLRLWSIQYKKELFPKILNEDFKWLESLLKIVEPQTERENIVLSFYKKHMEGRTNFKNLFFDPGYQTRGRTSYNDVTELLNYTDTNLNFYNVDFFQKTSIKNDYDIILLSNVLEWSHSEERLKQAVLNLAALTRKDGLVICSRLFPSTDLEQEKEFFAPYFEQENLGKTYIYHRK